MAMSDRKVDGRPNPHLEILKDNTEVYVETLIEDSYIETTMKFTKTLCTRTKVRTYSRTRTEGSLERKYRVRYVALSTRITWKDIRIIERNLLLKRTSKTMNRKEKEC